MCRAGRRCPCAGGAQVLCAGAGVQVRRGAQGAGVRAQVRCGAWGGEARCVTRWGECAGRGTGAVHRCGVGPRVQRPCASLGQSFLHLLLRRGPGLPPTHSLAAGARGWVSSDGACSWGHRSPPPRPTNADSERGTSRCVTCTRGWGAPGRGQRGAPPQPLTPATREGRPGPARAAGGCCDVLGGC